MEITIVEENQRLPQDAPTITAEETFQVAGESHYQAGLARLTGGPSGDGFRDDCTARLLPEPSNPHDPNAVAVYIGAEKVGHLGRDDAIEHRPAIDAAIAAYGAATVRATIKGGWDRGGGDTGFFGVELQLGVRPSVAVPGDTANRGDEPDEMGGNLPAIDIWG